MIPTIYLALTHDWELRGDGSGDIEEIQFAPMRRLLGLYKKFGARTSFFPDVMQQITFRSLQADHEELKRYAELWDKCAAAAYQAGHDIQLHLHSQWSAAQYENGRWNLKGAWSLLMYDADTVTRMIAACKGYLENLLCPLDPQYRCVAFRASALALAPSPHLLSSLASLGLAIDVSMAAGLYLNNETLKLDYRHCQETFLPYYPKLDDARDVSDKPEPVVCVPLNHFYGSRRAVTRQNLALAKARMTKGRGTVAVQGYKSARLDSRTTGIARVYEKLIAPAIRRKHFVSDTGRLNYRLMREMLASIRLRARLSGLDKVPVVLTNHPKDIRDWNGLERFIGDIAEAGDLEFITLTQLTEGLRNGMFQIRSQLP